MKIEVRWGNRSIELSPETADPLRGRFVWASADSNAGYFRATQITRGTTKQWSAVFSQTFHIGEGPTAQSAFDALRRVMTHDHRLLGGALG